MSNIGKPSRSPADEEILANPIAYEVRVFNRGWQTYAEFYSNGLDPIAVCENALSLRDKLRERGKRAAVYCRGYIKSRGNQEGVCII